MTTGPDANQSSRPLSRLSDGLEDSLAQLHTTPNMRALHVFTSVGSLTETSRQTGIPIYDLQLMSREPWWQRELQAIQREQTALENMRLSRMWGKALTKIEDALDHGQVVHIKGRQVMIKQENLVTGEIEEVPMRVPLNADQLARLAQVLFDQRQLVREQPTAIIASNSKLEQLAEKLTAYGKLRLGETIDVTPEKPDA